MLAVVINLLKKSYSYNFFLLVVLLQDLKAENKLLKDKVNMLENKVQVLEAENVRLHDNLPSDSVFQQ